MQNKHIHKWLAVALIIWAVMLAGASAQIGKSPKTTAILHDSIASPAIVPPSTTTTLPAVLEVQSAPQAQELTAEEARALYGRCGEWHDMALGLGWPAEEWPTLSKVMYRESRCDITAHNSTDPLSGSRGLLQINGYWCRPTKYSQNGWLQDQDALEHCDDLYQPEINLKAGLLIWLYGEQKHGCGWRGPWATSCK